MDVQPLVEEFDLVRWAEEGLDNISVVKLGKITSAFLKSAPKTLMLPDGLIDLLKKVRELTDLKKAEAKAALPAAAAPDKPTTAADGVALPVVAAPGEPQLTTEDRATLMQQFSTDTSFRAVVMGALKMLSESSGSIMEIDDICDKPGCMLLRILFEDALQDQDEYQRSSRMLSAQIMSDILQGFATEADAHKAAATSSGSTIAAATPAAATPEAALPSAALPSAAAIRVGDIVTGRATKFKDKYHNFKA